MWEERFKNDLSGLPSPLILSAVKVFSLPENYYLESQAVFAKNGKLVGEAYAKQNLMPFGEYIPIVHLFPWLNRKINDLIPFEFNFRAGNEVKVINSGEILKIGAPVCFDLLDAGVNKKICEPESQCPYKPDKFKVVWR